MLTWRRKAKICPVWTPTILWAIYIHFKQYCVLLVYANWITGAPTGASSFAPAEKNISYYTGCNLLRDYSGINQPNLALYLDTNGINQPSLALYHSLNGIKHNLSLYQIRLVSSIIWPCTITQMAPSIIWPYTIS